MEFQKGYAVGKVFIPEGQDIKVVTMVGEVLEGTLIKASKKEFVLQIAEVMRIIRTEDVDSMSELTKDEEQELVVVSGNNELQIDKIKQTTKPNDN